MPIRSVIRTVRDALEAYPTLHTHYDPTTQEASPGKFRTLDESSLHPEVLDYLRRKYPGGLFSHQHEAIENVLAGKNTVVATRTSSGKSLIYSLPVFNALCRDAHATALFIYPQKALANDQLIKLRDMAGEISSVSRLLADKRTIISRYDGSTPSEDRPGIRRDVQVVLTNPDMLHLGIMQHHERHWRRFFQNLRLVAIDECHEYRGVFGTNVAYVLRRLRQLCRFHGSDPRFVATSATVRDPQSHLESLTGVPFECVDSDRDGSLQGRRKFWMVSADDHYYDLGRKLAFALAGAGLTVLAFCPSRVAAERMISRLHKSEADEPPYVRVYRSGLSAAQREEIERGLRDRSVRLVFSTSALELGIDIGELDVVICIGMPNSMMSLWQRAGRAARGGREGATVFIPAETPIDTYFANHPEELFARDHEPLVLNLANRRLVCQHYACAVQEIGGDEDRLYLDVLGQEIARVSQLRSEGGLNRDEFYRADPHMEVNIRSAGEGAYSLMLGEERIGDIDSFHLLRETYRNAIYRHGGETFRVKDVIKGKKIVRLQREYSRNDTIPFIRKKIRLKDQFSTSDFSGVRIATAAMDVTEFLVSVTEKDRSGQVIRTWPGASGMPPHQLPTEGTMLLIRDSLWDCLYAELGGRTSVALQSCERLLCSLFPTVSGPCDTQDFSSGIDSLPTGEHAVFLYDMVYDGVGLTKTAFEQMDTLIEKSLERVESCECPTDEGCIRCIANPYVDQTASKDATRKVLRTIREMLECETPTIIHKEDDWTARLDLGQQTCSTCHSSVPPVARFCPNCGEKLEGNT